MRADAIAAHVDTRALGRIERQVRLSGKLPIDGERPARAAVCLTTRGLFLVAALDALRGAAVDLAVCPDLRIDLGRMGAQLTLGEHRFGVPAHRRQELLDLVAIGRLRGDRGGGGTHVMRGRHIEAPTEVERTWLGRALQHDELLLAWLRTRTAAPVASTIMEVGVVPFSLVLTDRRVLLVAISPVGDALVEEVAPESWELLEDRAPVTVMVPGRQLTSARTNSDLFRELGGAVPLDPESRLIELARLNWLDRKTVGLTLCRSLLEAAIRRGDGRGRAAAFLVGVALDEPRGSLPELAPTTDWLNRTAASPDAIADLWHTWGHTPAAGLALMAALRALGGACEPWALRLHRRAHASEHERLRNGLPLAHAELLLAEHLVEAGEPEEATALVRARLDKLPTTASCELRPPSDMDPGAEGEDRRLRTRGYELLARARGTAEAPDPEALLALARLHPLSRERIAALARHCSSPLKERAANVEALLSPGALRPGNADAVHVGDSLPEVLLNQVLRHPLTRADSPLVGKLQTLLALVPVPDYSVLRDYCERISPERQTPALGALREASGMLGVPEVQAFISRGVKGVGLRAYEGSPPFILIGGRHLDPESPYYMQPAELRFALGAEVAHLRFGHHRVTANEVWAGAMNKGKEGLGLALGMLPALRGWRIADRVVSVTSRVPIGPVKRVMAAAQELNERVGEAAAPPTSSANRNVISALNEDFIVAHRVMQLTADRAGLVLAGNLGAAVRAMLLVRRDYRDELSAVEQQGLREALGARAENGQLAYLDLVIRIAALISFYLSDDFTCLRDPTRS